MKTDETSADKAHPIGEIKKNANSVWCKRKMIIPMCIRCKILKTT